MADIGDKTTAELFGDGTPPRTTRDKLIHTAMDLFYTYGFQDVGIDQIIREVGVTKTTFYNHFECKEDLIVEVIKLRDKWEMEAFSRMLQEKAGYDPKAMLTKMFDVMDEWFTHPDYKGCLFLIACTLFPSPNDPIHQAASGHYLGATGAIEQMAEAAGVSDPAALAHELVLLLQGLITFRLVTHNDDAAKIAKRIARDRLATYLSNNTPAADA